jgi:phosphatidylinositol-3,4,5-trisphosphate 3-phosphatase/dual-specificity protein phosphatase PTEN
MNNKSEDIDTDLNNNKKGNPFHFIKRLVSKKKNRFYDGKFDLDLSYITKQIIAMGFPSESVEGVYRNSMAEVKKMLQSKHGDNYKVYNLCSEKSYSQKSFP